MLHRVKRGITEMSRAGYETYLNYCYDLLNNPDAVTEGSPPPVEWLSEKVDNFLLFAIVRLYRTNKYFLPDVEKTTFIAWTQSFDLGKAVYNADDGSIKKKRDGLPMISAVGNLAYQVAFLTQYSLNRRNLFDLLGTTNVENLDTVVSWFKTCAPWNPAVAEQNFLYMKYMSKFDAATIAMIVQSEMLSRILWARQYCIVNLASADQRETIMDTIATEMNAIYTRNIGPLGNCSTADPEAIKSLKATIIKADTENIGYMDVYDQLSQRVDERDINSV